MEHKFLRLFVDGEWTGNPDRSISIAGVKHDLDEYAKTNGIKLPDAKKSKKTINTDVEVKDEDMERSHDTGNTEIDGDGDSESTE
tara:strand:+ start:321 stop:575 length:255 start_codon:yes stop_codon:yes gene_type:complete